MIEGERRRSAMSDLDCLFCGRWFPTFNRLGEHVKRVHSRARDGEVTASIGRVLTRQKDRPMALPKPNKDSGGGSGDFNPILKVKQIGKLGTKAKLVLRGSARLVDGSYGEQLFVETLFKGKVYDWPVRTNSPNYRLLFERFGSNERKWKGPVNVEIKHFGTNDYIAVDRGK